MSQTSGTHENRSATDSNDASRNDGGTDGHYHRVEYRDNGIFIPTDGRTLGAITIDLLQEARKYNDHYLSALAEHDRTCEKGDMEAACLDLEDADEHVFEAQRAVRSANNYLEANGYRL